MLKKLLAFLFVLVVAASVVGAFSFHGLVDKVLSVYEDYVLLPQEPIETPSFSSFYGTYRFTEESYPDMRNIFETEARKSSTVAGYLSQIPAYELAFPLISITLTVSDTGTLSFSAEMPLVTEGTFLENAIPYMVESETELRVTLTDEFSGKYRGKIAILTFSEDYRCLLLKEQGDEEEVLRLYRQ